MIDEDASSSEDEEQDEEPEAESASTVMVLFGGEGESDMLEEDFDDAPLVHFATQNWKVRADDSNNPTPIHVAFDAMPIVSTDDVTLTTCGDVLTSPSLVPSTFPL